MVLLVYETFEIDLSYTKTALLVYETSKRGTEEGAAYALGSFTVKQAPPRVKERE